MPVKSMLPNWTHKHGETLEQNCTTASTKSDPASPYRRDMGRGREICELGPWRCRSITAIDSNPERGVLATTHRETPAIKSLMIRWRFATAGVFNLLEGWIEKWQRCPWLTWATVDKGQRCCPPTFTPFPPQLLRNSQDWRGSRAVCN